MLDSFKPGQELMLKAFDGYWGGKPGADRLVFRFIPEAATRINALRTGAVDVIDAVPVQLVQSSAQDPERRDHPPGRPAARSGSPSTSSRESLEDVQVRRALNLAVPVETIAERVFFGFAKAPDSPLAFDTVGHKTSRQGESSTRPKAEALLAEAGYQAGRRHLERDGKPL